MHIFSSHYSLYTKDATFFLPHVRYVVPDGVARDIQAALVERYGDGAQYRLSHFNSYERRYAGQTMGPRESLLIYRHGAIGDTLITTAVVAEIRRRTPGASIDLYCRPGNAELWHGLGVNVLPGYPPFDAARQYTHHLLFENGMECDSEDDQGCAMDAMLSFAGIDPASVPDERKVPVVVPNPKLDGGEIPKGHERIVIQAGASNGNRTWPHIQQLVRLLSDAGMQSVVFGEKQELPTFRNLIPWVKAAPLVICPDSSIGHLAAAFPSVPVISLWGLFDPKDRVRYYTNHHPLTGFAACPHAPCRSHEYKLPRKCIDAPAFDGKSCAALASITPEMVVAKAREILKL